mmetsp:Transcript_41827/g.110272  ORF Transcript_41827/g.110272 Transcript_41827/m.110272 type:complete len:85 (-) Transcript_41827:669-923(-)
MFQQIQVHGSRLEPQHVKGQLPSHESATAVGYPQEYQGRQSSKSSSISIGLSSADMASAASRAAMRFDSFCACFCAISVSEIFS